MKFRTEIEVAPWDAQIDYDSHILALGSCFAEHIAAQLTKHKFRVAANPAGILFNPLSIAATIRSFHSAEPILPKELHQAGELWFHHGFHGSLSTLTAEEALLKMNAARQAGTEALRRGDFVLLTFGTAWVYERDGEVVANCHKQPSSEFMRRRLSVAQIVAAYDDLLASSLAGKQVVLTVSPVRHLGDGFEGNSVSKAILRLAAEELAESHPNVVYFPAYEIINDDLRDYRFYADDLLHPAPQAVDYVWAKFSAAALTDQAQRLLPVVARIVEAAAHRPQHSQSVAFKIFCRKQLEAVAKIPEVDFHAEEALLRAWSEDFT